MSRAFDSFDIDDFRGSDSSSELGMRGGSTPSWDKWRERQNMHREEERSDAKITQLQRLIAGFKSN